MRHYKTIVRLLLQQPARAERLILNGVKVSVDTSWQEESERAHDTDSPALAQRLA